MSSVVIQFRNRAKGNVSFLMVLWALAMTVILFLEIVAPTATTTVVGFGVSAVLGVYLGVRRRVGAAFIAPIISWLFAWLPLIVACMIHYGIFKGFLYGLVTITFGWILIGFVEFAWVWMVAMLVRSMRGPSRGDPIVIIDPDRN